MDDPWTNIAAALRRIRTDLEASARRLRALVPRFRVFRPRALQAVAQEWGMDPRDLRQQALDVGLTTADLPDDATLATVFRVCFQGADRYLRDLEREILPGGEPLPENITREPTTPAVPDHEAARRWEQILATAGPSQRMLLNAWYAQPDATLADVARSVGMTPNAARQAVDRLRRREG